VSGPVGIIGGSGLYSLLDDAEELRVQTPYGDPSAALVATELAGRRIVFLPRHGRDHEFPAHRVPYRANLWALHSLGVRQVLAPCAVGALDRTLEPGSLVIPDQLIDRTSGRESTFYDEGAVHVPFADPYCRRGRAWMATAAAEAGWRVRDRGTMVVINGPRFASRAESEWHAASGGTIVNMTGMPEAVLARELAICFTAVALVTDLDAGLAEGESVTQESVFEVFRRSTDALRQLLLDAVAGLPDERSCECPGALDGTAAESRWS
jgi:5'-methylthioadenosine phosphorylase